MDTLYFFERRLAFICQLYSNAARPFEERKRLIEGGQAPFSETYSEDPEPPFLEEWVEAEESLQVLGQACISMLSAATHVHLKTLVWKLRIQPGDRYKPAFKRGWFQGYGALFAGDLGIRFSDSKCDLELIEEIVLARNRVQHPESPTTNGVTYSDDDLAKLISPRFVSDNAVELYAEMVNGKRIWWTTPPIVVTSDRFLKTIDEVRRLATWLDVELVKRS